MSTNTSSTKWLKELLPYCDQVLFPKEKTVKKPVSKELVDTNHKGWTGCHFEEFERCQKTCLWNQQKELLVEEEYVPFKFPRLPGWVNCNL
jgi:hypothetical protein